MTNLTHWDTKRHWDVIRAAQKLVEQWRQKILNNQTFELDLWEAVDLLQDKDTVDENWLREQLY